METKEPIGARLQQIIMYYGLNKSTFSYKIGLTNNATVVRIIGDPEAGISFEVLQRIGRTFPEVSMEWLVMGIGRMMKDAKAEATPTFNISYFHNRSEVATDFLHIAGYGDCDMAFDDVVGDAMAPKIISGDVLLCRTVTPDQIVFGEAYRIVTVTGIVYIRYLMSSAGDNLILGAENQRYREQEVNKVELAKIYAIKGIIRRVAY